MNGKVWRKGLFSINGESWVEGFTRGDLWKGFACPVFDKAGAECINQEFFYGEPVVWDYDAAFDAFSLEQYSGGGDTWSGYDIKVDGVTHHVYPIGAGQWEWVQKDENQPVKAAGADNTKLVTKALDAFWAVVTDEFPLALTGDMSPEKTVALQQAAGEAVTEWITRNATDQREKMLKQFFLDCKFSEWEAFIPMDFLTIMRSVTDLGLKSALKAMSYCRGERVYVARAFFQAWFDGEAMPIVLTEDEK